MVWRIPPAKPDDHVSSVLIVAKPVYALIVLDIAALKMFQRYAADVAVFWARVLCLRRRPK
jgi:hypothetical protein